MARKILSFKKNRNGDTIVEVIFSIAVLSFTVVSLMSVMQKGSNAAQLSLELSLARNHMNAQAEAIRFINSSIQNRERGSEAGQLSDYSIVWQQMVASSSNVSDWEDMTIAVDGKRVCNEELLKKSFVLDLTNLSGGLQKGDSLLRVAEIYPRIVYSNNYDSNKIEINKRFVRSEGIWIEVERAGGGLLTEAYDFHIRACWKSVGQSAPITLGTIVRVHVSKSKGVN